MIDMVDYLSPSPARLQPYFEKPRLYNCLYGGRASGKSWAAALFHLYEAQRKKCFILCLREVQKSIKNSSYKLLSNLIRNNNMGGFEITKEAIYHRGTGSEFIFLGLRDTDPEKIKSAEGLTHVWAEEAQSLSKFSLETLEPTIIRNSGCMLTFTFNRFKADDPVWKKYCANPTDDTLIVKINYNHNPYVVGSEDGSIPPNMQILKAVEKMKAQDFSEYLHVWEGEPYQSTDDQLFNAMKLYECRGRPMNTTGASLVIGVDIGVKVDKTCFAFREGRKILKVDSHRFNSTMEVVNYIVSLIHEWRPVKVVLDIGGEGLGVYDRLNELGYGQTVAGINFGASANNPMKYKNKRAEMYYTIKNEIEEDAGLSLPDDDELFDDLMAQRLKHTPNYILQLIDKEQIKKDLGRSPDKADALALTFVLPFCPTNSPFLRFKKPSDNYQPF